MTDPITILQGDCRDTLKTIPDGTVHCCVTSPPYWGLRSYLTTGHDDKHREIGQEPTPDAYVQTMVEVFREVRRVLHDSGTVWLNVGDSYASACACDRRSIIGQGSPDEKCERPNRLVGCLKEKDLCLIPWRLAIALQADGWWVRSVICWAKKSCMPESVTDRPTNSWEPIFLLAKSSRYFYDAEAVKEPSQGIERPSFDGARGTLPKGSYQGVDRCGNGDGSGRNQRNVWHLGPEPFNGDAIGGTCRIASPDCRVHDYRAFLARALECDEQLGASAIPRSHYSDDRPFELQEGAVVSIPISRSEFPSDDFSATAHNICFHKTAGELEPSGIFAGMLEPDTECNKRIRRCVSKFFRKPVNKTEADSLANAPDLCPSAETVFRIFGTLTFEKVDDSCCCQYIGKVEKRQDHFAVFPTEIPRRAILAGTSARGCCPSCFAPWVRVTKSSKTFESGSGKAGNRPNGKQDLSGSETNSTPDIRMGPVVSTRTVGWEPGCDHGLEPVPCLVCDPFAGSGTVGAVALELGRHAILCELNPDYVELIKTRTHVTPGLLGI